MKTLPSAQPKPVESKVDILQMLKNATTAPKVAPSPNHPTLQNAGNDLLRVLTGNNQPQSSPTNHNGSTSQPIMMTPYNNNSNNSNNMHLMQQQQQPENMLSNKLKNLFIDDMTGSNTENNNHIPPNTRRIIANGELTKPFYPPFMSSPVASPNNQRNPNTLLQALHGGLPPPLPPLPQPLVGMPLLPQQAIGLMGPEISRRFANRPLLSKPEFIQQLLNMIQCDPTFFDVLYKNYESQMGSSTNHPTL
ncbi:uncharacterized protein BX663DRAFT_514110 [Cokeromyces recurvatus]|uniref:uncharacterized protein n=1 Tax=Cokeromyces recurvatus TaxID=90255 RepID=UPI00221EB50A|nr:uncharacterized protein BX663DRAFT_514110 [Cokeromyces recurvatus]KAI7901325.1 hypothetical protein BX663DRAFT_514110 [Cokeromyces recurvatus]